MHESLVGVKPVEQKLKYFGYKHLPAHLQPKSKIFHDLANELISHKCNDVAELIRALNKLIESKDCFVRSQLN